MNRESKFLSRVLRHEPELVDLPLAPMAGCWLMTYCTA